jgi:hypothetical protein
MHRRRVFGIPIVENTTNSCHQYLVIHSQIPDHVHTSEMPQAAINAHDSPRPHNKTLHHSVITNSILATSLEPIHLRPLLTLLPNIQCKVTSPQNS